jgi:hypothetical protein
VPRRLLPRRGGCRGALVARKPTEALASARKGTELDPSFYETFDILSLILGGLRQHAAADSAHRRAVEVAGGDYWVRRFDEGLLASQRGDTAGVRRASPRWMAIRDWRSVAACCSWPSRGAACWRIGAAERVVLHPERWCDATLSVAWFPGAASTSDLGQLHVVLWRGTVTRRGGGVPRETASMLREWTLRPVDVSSDVLRWREDGDGAEYDIEGLAAHCLMLLNEQVQADDPTDSAMPTTPRRRD